MTVTYRVLVVRVDDTKRLGGYNGEPLGEVLFAAEAPSAERLLGYAPGEVEAALTDAAMVTMAEKFPLRVVQGSGDLDEMRATAAANPDAVTALPPQNDESALAGGEEKPKRRRRTKAEIEADKAAELAAAAPAPETPDPPADPDDKVYGEPVPAPDPLHTTEDQAAPAPAGVQVTTSLESVAPVLPAAESAPAAPWNPFAK